MTTDDKQHLDTPPVWTDIQMDRHTNGQTHKWTDTQMDRHTTRVDRHTTRVDRHTNGQTHDSFGQAHKWTDTRPVWTDTQPVWTDTRPVDTQSPEQVSPIWRRWLPPWSLSTLVSTNCCGWEICWRGTDVPLRNNKQTMSTGDRIKQFTGLSSLTGSQVTYRKNTGYTALHCTLLYKL